MTEAPAAASSRGCTPLTAPRVPTGMKAGVSITPCGVTRRPRRAAPEVAKTSSCRGMEGDLGLRLALAQVDHLGLDSLGELENIAVLGDAAVPLQVLEPVFPRVAVGLDVAHPHRQVARVVDPQGHRLQEMGR